MWGFSEYVPVAERIAKAKKYVKKSRKGKAVYPIEIEGRKIAKQFWGDLWCKYVESLADFENRLPRGRTYVRNGSVCHLEINKGSVLAYVAGSKPYTVRFTIDVLDIEKWNTIKQKCSGQIASVLELLQGRISENVMQLVADVEDGLFPDSGSIAFECNCPDWADMCKHVVAVFYGIAARLDDHPEQLFILRGVDPSELVSTELDISFNSDAEVIDDSDDLAGIFGIDLDDDEESNIGTVIDEPTVSQSPCSEQIDLSKIDLGAINGSHIRLIRHTMALSVSDFADALGVTNASVYRWEKQEKNLRLQEFSKEGIRLLIASKS